MAKKVTQHVRQKWPLGHLLHQAVQAADAAYESRAEGLRGLTPRQYAVLTAVGEATAPPSQTELIRTTSIDRSTLTGVVGRLVKGGLLQRRRSKSEARAYALSLTAAGREVLAKGVPAATAGDILAAEALGAERLQILVRMLEEFVDYAGTPDDDE